ncbi:hypothetical protein ACTRXD_18040 [Nitrospira sp. T9]|uniref:hypothetical protein n=1 Tax=unclassified Nitrospira TaxID=2652172 RepID=UPI003F99D5FC
MLEAGTGLSVILALSATTMILVGTSLDTDGGLIIARIGGAPLLSLDVACWFARDDGQSRAAKGLVTDMLLYNVGAVGVFLYAGKGLGLTDNGIWPSALLHTGLAIWCLGGLRFHMCT